jgi:tetratricopeptide (TPR) repeat protein
MAKSPEQRYATARALADDLQRFLRNETVRARRPTALDRVWKLARQHAPAIVTAVLILAVLVAALSVATVAVTRERNAAQAAARQERMFAAAERRQRELAETSFSRAHALVDRVFARATRDLAGVPHSDRIRHALIEDTLHFYDQLYRDRPAEPEVQHDMARAFQQVGEMHVRLGGLAEAEQSFVQANAMLVRLANQHPGVPAYRVSLGHNLRGLAHLQAAQTGHGEQAERLLTERVLLFADLAAGSPQVPDYRCELASALTDRADFFASAGRLREAEADFRQALDLRNRNRDRVVEPADACLGRVSTLHGLANLLLSTCRLSEADQLLREARTRQQELIRVTPYDDRLRYDLLRIEYDLGRICCHSDHPGAGEAHLRAALALGEDLVHDHPDAVRYRLQLARTWQGVSRALSAQQRDREAREALDTSTSSVAAIVDELDGSLAELLLLAENYRLAGTRDHGDRQVAAAEAFLLCHSLLERCTNQFPAAAQPRAELAFFLGMCPDQRFRDAARAAVLADQAIQLAPQLAQGWRARGVACLRDAAWQASVDALLRASDLTHGGDAIDWYLLAMAYAQLQDGKEAHRWYLKALCCSARNHWDAEQLALLQAEAAGLLTPTF